MWDNRPGFDASKHERTEEFPKEPSVRRYQILSDPVCEST
jgi:hypothetical protein